MSDIAITWPKNRPLDSYLSELVKAKERQLVINYRVPTWPQGVVPDERCWIVYDGYVRGYNNILGIESKEDVVDPLTGLYMRPGIYIVRDPEFFTSESESQSVAMKSFRGYRYVRRELMYDAEAMSWWERARVA